MGLISSLIRCFTGVTEVGEGVNQQRGAAVGGLGAQMGR